MSYVKSRRIVEHTWTCSSCGKVNLGRHIECLQCGKPKNDEKYDESVKATVTDSKVLAESKRGPNWTCAYCKYENRGDLSKCKQCGADRKDASTTEMRTVTIGRYPRPSEVFEDGGGYRDAAKVKTSVRDSLPPMGAMLVDHWRGRLQRARKPVLIGIAVTTVIGLLIWGGIWLFTPWQETVKVTSASHERPIFSSVSQ